MATLINRAKQQLEKGELCLGLGLRMARTADIGRVLHTCGYDYAFIDMEHNSMNLDTAVQIGVA
jgi:2-keto-3-deoxy-L-rhamnonate aldolase RhmA